MEQPPASLETIETKQKKPQKKTLTEEQRQALRDRMKKVQENRWKGHTKKEPEPKKEEEARVLPEDDIQKINAKKSVEKSPTKSQENINKKKKPYCKLVFYEKPDENFKFKWGKKTRPHYGIEEIDEECEQESEEESEDEEEQKKNNLSSMARNFFG